MIKAFYCAAGNNDPSAGWANFLFAEEAISLI